VNSLFETRGSGQTVIARAPTNGGKNYPYSEAVLINCALSGIDPAGWGPIGGETENIRYWEYASINARSGKPEDVSRRHPASRQLTMQKDAALISSYKNPAYVLGGWTPHLEPLILAQPQSTSAVQGQSLTLSVAVASIPESSYQWYKDGKIIQGSTGSVLVLNNVRPSDAGNYRVEIQHDGQRMMSTKAALTIR